MREPARVPLVRWARMRLSPLAMIPAGLVGVVHEITRHLLRRPVVGIAAAATVPDGRWLLIRRADTGTWALPGGTLEWGETLRSCLPRELEEEAGVTSCELGDVVGVFSEPKRDVRFHAVTVVVRCTVGMPIKAPKNPMEIREVGMFSPAEIPRPLAMGMDPMIDAAIAGRIGQWE
jgi:8-oxo-dGTP diphosphatase